MKYLLSIITILVASVLQSSAFCGFYVAKAGAQLFNNKSQVIFVRDGNKSVITMSNDFTGNTSDFAMVIPVPEVLERKDIQIANQVLFDKFDAYSGPRLVEYYDHNPCNPMIIAETVAATSIRKNRSMRKESSMEVEDDYSVHIEASYTVGEYDILILSATESDGLKRWLIDNDYKIPAKAERVLEPYIKSNMKFFVVKVNTELMEMQGFKKLRPLRIQFESEKFMLPIRLGMANSKGAQDMIVYTFTRKGRVEAANYRTVQIPTSREIPTFLKSQKFDQFYVDLFEKAYKTAGRNAVFTEYAWDVSPTARGVKCDPCVGPPPIVNDLKQAGVWWVNERNYNTVFFTRLHVRYSEDRFPEDLFFIQTSDRQRFQGRYIVRHPATGDLSCDEGVKYTEKLKRRRGKELRELAALTDWNVTKYSKYQETGSSWIDEKQGDPAKGKNSSKGSSRMLIILLGGVIAFVATNYIGNLKRIVYRR